MENNMDYLRIGTDYFKKVHVPLSVDEGYDSIIKWSKQEIIQDHGRDYIKQIPKYDGFCNIPEHQNFQPVVNGFYNQYHPLSVKPKKGPWKTIEIFLRHIFGEQFITSLDYLTILYRHPTQVLPILALVSEERNTGKSTFLQFLKLLFEKNVTINTNEDFRSRFNSDWSNKLIVAIDEVLLDKREDSERLKNLSTAQTYKTEAKGKDKTETAFFGKIVLCSNNEDNFVLIDNNEIRYWVRKINSLNKNGSKPDPAFLERMNNEIPHFIHLLATREIAIKKRTRMWFTTEHLHTEALQRLVKGTTSSLLREIIEVLREIFDLTDDLQLAYGAKDLLPLLKDNGIQSSTRRINEIIKTRLNLEQKNSSYVKQIIGYNSSNERYLRSVNERGRHFIFERKKIEPFW